MNNVARQGTWADNIIIQAVVNSLNITINIIESDANFSPVTVINPVNTDRQRTNIQLYWPYTRISLYANIDASAKFQHL